MSVPLSAEQIDAANRLHARLPQWRRSDSALHELAQAFPGFDQDAVLLKVIAVNALYGTNVYAVMRMAEHVRAVISEPDLGGSGSKLVERIADLPPLPGQKPRRYLSFASKFAHFFIDAERFPILDTYSEKMVRWHLGRANCVRDKEHRYRAFVQNYWTLKDAVGWTGASRALDRYLWLAGQHRAWRRKREVAIGVEVRALFENPTGQAAEDLGLLEAAST